MPGLFALSSTISHLFRPGGTRPSVWGSGRQDSLAAQLPALLCPRAWPTLPWTSISSIENISYCIWARAFQTPHSIMCWQFGEISKQEPFLASVTVVQLSRWTKDLLQYIAMDWQLLDCIWQLAGPFCSLNLPSCFPTSLSHLLESFWVSLLHTSPLTLKLLSFPSLRRNLSVFFGSLDQLSSEFQPYTFHGKDFCPASF